MKQLPFLLLIALTACSHETVTQPDITTEPCDTVQQAPLPEPNQPESAEPEKPDFSSLVKASLDMSQPSEQRVAALLQAEKLFQADPASAKGSTDALLAAILWNLHEVPDDSLATNRRRLLRLFQNNAEIDGLEEISLTSTDDSSGRAECSDTACARTENREADIIIPGAKDEGAPG